MSTNGGSGRDEAVRSIYQEVILDHYRHPRHRGRLEVPHREVAMRNPTCGDEILLQVAVEGEAIRDVRFEGQGCAISQATASMMAELVRGRTREDVTRLADSFRALLHGTLQPAPARELGSLRALAGVARLPGRVRCAMLAWNALETALHPDSQDPEPPSAA